MSSYLDRVEAEIANYADQEVVHDLPPIYHVWSGRHTMPLLQEVGFESLWAMFDQAVAEQCALHAPDSVTMVSVGAGNGDVEVALAKRLSEKGFNNLRLVLVELNSAMLERATAHSQEAGIAERVRTVCADLNTWSAEGPAHVYFANHSLHHVVELEHLFEQISSSLDPRGVLLVNDMIGRNGHQRWPEAAAIVHGIWANMPERYRLNHYTGTVDPVYPDIDCSGESFEGIRAQDILPLLLKMFHPESYITFANVVDPFVDRVYGPNFDPDNEADVSFIEMVAQLDDAALDLGALTPTHLLGTFRPTPVECKYPRGRSPQRTLRPEPPTDQAPHPAAASDAADVIDLAADDRRELEAAVREARAQYEHLLGRKSVRLALQAADFRRSIFPQR